MKKAGRIYLWLGGGMEGGRGLPFLCQINLM